jgi:hypothetical protein
MSVREIRARRVVIEPTIEMLGVLFGVNLACLVAPEPLQWAVGFVSASLVPALRIGALWAWRSALIRVGDAEVEIIGRRTLRIPRATLPAVALAEVPVRSPILAGIARPYIERLTGRTMQLGCTVRLALAGLNLLVVFGEPSSAERFAEMLTESRVSTPFSTRRERA